MAVDAPVVDLVEVHAVRYLGPVLDGANPLRDYYPSLINSRSRRRDEDRDPSACELPLVGIQCVLPREGRAKAVDVLGTIRTRLRVHANQVLTASAAVEVHARDDWPSWTEAVRFPGSAFARASRVRPGTASDVTAGFVEGLGVLEPTYLDLSGVLRRVLGELVEPLRRSEERACLPATPTVHLRAAVDRESGREATLTWTVDDSEPRSALAATPTPRLVRTLEHAAAHELLVRAATDSVRKHRAFLRRAVAEPGNVEVSGALMSEQLAFLSTVEPAWHFGDVPSGREVLEHFATATRVEQRWERALWMFEQIGLMAARAGAGQLTRIVGG